MSYSKAVLSGTVETDPEKRFTPNNHAVTSFNLTVDNPNFKANQPISVKITCWRNTAEAVAEQVQRGEEILVEGKLMLNVIQGQDGSQKRQYEVDASSVVKLGAKPVALRVAPEDRANNAGGGGQSPAPRASQPQQQQYAAAAPAAGGMSSPAPQFAGGGASFPTDDLLTEDDIPF